MMNSFDIDMKLLNLFSFIFYAKNIDLAILMTLASAY